MLYFAPRQIPLYHGVAKSVMPVMSCALSILILSFLASARTDIQPSGVREWGIPPRKSVLTLLWPGLGMMWRWRRRFSFSYTNTAAQESSLHGDNGDENDTENEGLLRGCTEIALYRRRSHDSPGHNISLELDKDEMIVN
jgi:hypothetical protein